MAKHVIIVSAYLSLDIDEAIGLHGECDFILSLSKIPDFIKAPIFAITEAKKMI